MRSTSDVLTHLKRFATHREAEVNTPKVLIRLDHAPFGRDHREGLQPCSWRAVPFRSDVRRTPPREATQTPGRSSPAGRSLVGPRPPACHTGPPGATRPSSKDAPSDVPATCTFSAP